MSEFDSDRDAVITRARDAGVDFLLSIGDGSDAGLMARSLELAHRYSWIRTTTGIHPHQASAFNRSVCQRMVETSRDAAVIAWGEIGLDYHYNYSPPTSQREAFEEQVRAGVDRGLPLIVHCREAEDDTYRILSTLCRPGRLNGIMHCFTGNMEFAERMVGIGFMISFSGIVTFPRSEPIRDAASKLPEDVILVETDSPYLAPVPHRGKRNEPAFVGCTAEAVAKLRGITASRLAEITTQNFRAMFPQVTIHENL